MPAGFAERPAALAGGVTPDQAQAAHDAIDAITRKSKRVGAFGQLCPDKQAKFSRDKIQPITLVIERCVGLVDLPQSERWTLDKLAGIAKGVKRYDNRIAAQLLKLRDDAISEYRLLEEARLKSRGVAAGSVAAGAAGEGTGMSLASVCTPALTAIEPLGLPARTPMSSSIAVTSRHRNIVCFDVHTR